MVVELYRRPDIFHLHCLVIALQLPLYSLCMLACQCVRDYLEHVHTFTLPRCPTTLRQLSPIVKDHSMLECAFTRRLTSLSSSIPI